MKKIFVTPEVRLFNVETEIICQSDTIGINDTPITEGELDAPVRMDIFNYGGLK